MAGGLNITVLNPADDAEYTAFLDTLGRNQEGVLAYHYPFYRDMLVRIGIGEPCYLAARRGGDIAGVLPGFTKTASAGTVYCSLPYFGPNAGVLCPPHDETAHALLLSAALDHLSGARDPVAASFYTPLYFDRYRLYEDAFPPTFLRVDKFTQSQDPADYNPPRKLRYDVRKAVSSGARVSTRVTPDRVDQLYALYAANCRLRGIPLKPRETLDAVLELGAPHGRVEAYFAVREEQVVAGCVILRSPATVSVYMLATREDSWELQPASLLVDRALRDAADRGLSRWNWEASPNRGGVYRFKKKWGAIESAYRTYVLPFKPPEFFRALGAEGIQEQWPHYFVYPFSRLE